MAKNHPTIRILLLMAVFAFVWCAQFQPARAIWHVVLNEHFMGTPLSWMNSPGYGWGNWDCYPYPAYGPPYTWGITSYIFKYNGIDSQSLWCVGTPNTLAPELDPYPANTNAWVRWGPIDLSEAVKARASFWFYCQTEPVQDYVRWGAYPSSQWNMYESGRYSGETTEWLMETVDFDSLEGGTISLLGQNNVFLFFQFVSDYDSQVDMGAFIDEVNIAWEDGVFDLEAELAFLASLDSTQLMETFVGDSVRFALSWKAKGDGTTPMFDITCQLDGELFYSERRNAEIGSNQQIWVYTYTEPWVVEADTHTVFWMLDASREIDESSETNNDTSMTFVPLPTNSAPWLSFFHPTWGDTANQQFTITWEDGDPDDNAIITLYYDDDSTGNNGYVIPGAYNIPEDDPTNSFNWNVTGMPEGPFWVLGYITDTHNFSWVYSDGPLIIDHDWTGVRDDRFLTLPQEITLESVYPNPFNNSTKIRFGLPAGDQVQVKIFDSLGRLRSEAFKGWLSAGYHEITWSPGELPSGIYIVEIGAAGVTHRGKVVFLK